MSRFPRPCIGAGDGRDCPEVVPPGVERCRDCTQRYERRRGSGLERFGPGWEGISKRILERDGYECHWCGAPATTADHLIPRAVGGGNEEENLVASCLSCNVIRGNVQRRGRSRG